MNAESFIFNSDRQTQQVFSRETVTDLMGQYADIYSDRILKAVEALRAKMESPQGSNVQAEIDNLFIAYQQTINHPTNDTGTVCKTVLS